jgi:hypothetical protein
MFFLGGVGLFLLIIPNFRSRVSLLCFAPRFVECLRSCGFRFVVSGALSFKNSYHTPSSPLHL